MHAVKSIPIQWTGSHLIWNGIKITRLPPIKKPCRINWNHNCISNADGKRLFSLPRGSPIKPELLAIYAQITGVDLEQLLVGKDCEVVCHYGNPEWVLFRQKKVFRLLSYEDSYYTMLGHKSAVIWNKGLYFAGIVTHIFLKTGV